MPSQSLEHMCKAGKTLSPQMHLFQTEVKQRIILLGSHTLNQCPLDGIFGATFSHFCAFLAKETNAKLVYVLIR